MDTGHHDVYSSVSQGQATEAASGSLYLGELATAAEWARLAADYRSAAHLLKTMGRKRDPISRAPCGLVAVHSIELYLSLFLKLSGVDPKEIRRLNHDLAKRMELAITSGLVLRKKTQAHLSSLSVRREYLIVRYAPDLTSTLSQIDRLMATLDEIADKVDKRMPATWRRTMPARWCNTSRLKDGRQPSSIRPRLRFPNERPPRKPKGHRGLKRYPAQLSDT